MATYKCVNPNCGKNFDARPADRARGWAKHCSKSCAAWTREKRIDRNDYRNNGKMLDRNDIANGGWDEHFGKYGGKE